MEASHSARSREAGQAIVIIVFAFVGLLAFVGISVDLGRYLVAQAQLRRAVDAAALAGAAQFRLAGLTSTPDTVYDKVNQAARAMLRAHNVPTSTLETGVGVFTTFNDPSMVTSPPTKKVRVEAKAELPLIFLSLVGWHSVALSTDATSEAASVDVALVLDISDSMADDTCAGSDYPCQYTCVQARNCQPFESVRSAALEFLNYLSPGYDRVTVIPFAGKVGYCTQFGETWPECGISGYNSPNPSSSPNPTYLQMPWTPDKIPTNIDDARAFIDGLKMAIPDWALDPVTGQPIIAWSCPGYSPAQGWDPRQCVNTNTGGGLRAGATELLKEFDSRYAGMGRAWGPNHSSKERLRVIVLLSDGAVNMGGLPVPGEGTDYGSPSGSTSRWGFCPRSTWYSIDQLVAGTAGPFCRAAWPGFDIGSGRHISTSTEYDAVDYTLDWADFAMLEPPPNGNGNGIVAFAIGLGNAVIAEPRGDPQVGEKLLRYIAKGGDDGKLSTDPCAGVASGLSCGNYYFAPTRDQLLDVFKAIAGRIFTRINQ